MYVIFATDSVGKLDCGSESEEVSGIREAQVLVKDLLFQYK
jgi:hypothetical protein